MIALILAHALAVGPVEFAPLRLDLVEDVPVPPLLHGWSWLRVSNDGDGEATVSIIGIDLFLGHEVGPHDPHLVTLLPAGNCVPWRAIRIPARGVAYRLIPSVTDLPCRLTNESAIEVAYQNMSACEKFGSDAFRNVRIPLPRSRAAAPDARLCLPRDIPQERERP